MPTSWWRLALLNIGYRCVEFAERGFLFGDALVDRIKARWQAPRQPQVTR